MRPHPTVIRARRLFAVIAVLGVLLGLRVFSTGGPAFAADATTKYFGVFREGTPTQTASSVTSAYGVTPASVMWFDSWATGNAFPVAEAKALWAKGIMPHFTWEPWNTALGANGSGQIKLQDVINGTWDTYIKARGAEFASAGVPILLRWGHEFNGNWYPWGTANNNNDPSLYVRAYRHVHDLVKAAGATNVQWVWAYNTDSSPAASWNDPAQAYPGSGYVDWVGLDGYNWGYGPSWDPSGNHWVSFGTLFSNAYRNARSIAPNKPVMIAEYASSADGGDKAAWFRDMDAQLQSGSYPDLKLLTYFDQDKEELWSAGSSAASLTAFTAWLKKPYLNGRGTDLALVAGQYAGPTPTPTPTPTVTTPTPTVTTPTPTVTTPTSTAGGCTATYAVVSSWQGGFQAQLTVRNSGAAAISGWTLHWTLPSGEGVSQLWNGNLTVSGSSVTVTNVGWNGALGAGAGTTAGLIGSTGSASPAVPTVTCTAG